MRCALLFFVAGSAGHRQAKGPETWVSRLHFCRHFSDAREAGFSYCASADINLYQTKDYACDARN